jgi:tetratricopeptide (TPR) repeat protein
MKVNRKVRAKEVSMLRIYLLLWSLLVGDQCFAQYSPQEFPVASTTPLVSAEDVARVADYRGVSRAASDASISIARLSHKPMRRARAEFLRGLRFARIGAPQAAVAEFEKVVALDPNFSEAYGNLGVVYTWLGNFDEAVVALQRALRLDPMTAEHHANLAFALIQLKRYEEAKDEAQMAIWLDPGNSIAEFLLGYTLALRPETSKLSESHLIIAAKVVPEAHLVLAQVYDIQGAIHLARREMELYRGATQKTCSSVIKKNKLGGFTPLDEARANVGCGSGRSTARGVARKFDEGVPGSWGSYCCIW